MIRKAREGKGGVEQVDAHAHVPESPAGVFCHGHDTSVGGHMEAPRLIDPVLEFHFQNLGPFIVALTGGAVAVAGQKQSQVTRGLRFSRDDAVVKVQQGPQSGHGWRRRRARHMQNAALHAPAPVQPHHRQAWSGDVSWEQCGPPHRQLGGGTDRGVATGHQWHVRTVAASGDAPRRHPQATTRGP
jgi:hypothetical protein